ncbi:MAG: acetyl/propionyl/methylcrotonyl-CoA carboxylase subunit alpha [Glaciecola sp.]
MINKILIANRGEIACRVIRTAKRLGINTVAVYSEVDAHAQHVLMADEAVCLGEASAAKSYLNTDLILQHAKALNVDAIHPGYGFLSENAEFAKQCHQHDIIFIGPSAESISAMGSKSAAKSIMEQAQVPLVPGYHGDNQDPDFLLQQANAMGYPVLLKAAAGGGGKGMRQVWQESEFFSALEGAKRESMNSFGDDHMLIEKYLTEPRHIEIQIFCDKHNNGVYLFERDCSLQRRHQKIIEEAPAPNLPSDIRDKMGEAALKAAFAINYTGAGTVEFLYDTDGAFYFMEMNTRLQVEHPVTEFVTQEDLVEWQITVANGLPLPKTQAQLSLHGHAFEARIYAEDPSNEFLPSTGTIAYLQEPIASGNIRVDTGVVAGDEVSIYYDPMIAKLIVWSSNRQQALALLRRCLEQYMICGVTTNIPYLISVASSEAFENAELTTDFIERHSEAINEGLHHNISSITRLAILGVLAVSDNADSYNELSDFRLNHHCVSDYQFSINNHTFSHTLQHKGANRFSINVDNSEQLFSVTKGVNNITIITENARQTFSYYETKDTLWLLSSSGCIQVEKVHPDLGTQSDALGAGDIVAPMNGHLVSMLVAPTDAVTKGQVLAIVEAMKMEHSLIAPFDGEVLECFANAGDRVDGNAVLISMSGIDKP